MYKLILLFCLMSYVVAAQQNKMPAYTSPIVNDDKAVVFNVYAPQAKNVSLTGTIQPNDIPLTKTDDGLWTVTIGPLAPEIYHYQFYIDGAKVTDIKNQSPYP
ncbi:hypothetical protein QQ020_24330 [Fulvivirgaceae bacterium BMA12]|uniref:Glycoside hydrolase family 13 N-terminal domain-containing protein n=1 Tax=Agaribacillus aureus TaxID=3051825 RepID=A0ABT8LBS1_9BACT|nr:hypothetical protein [Fulvivirgaceae bacterium BMA12]